MRISWTTTPPTKSWETLKGKLWYCAKIKSWDFNVVTKLKLIAFVKMWVISLGQCVVPKHELLKLWLDPLLASAQLDAILINFISFWGFSSLSLLRLLPHNTLISDECQNISQQWFWNCHDNRLVKMTPVILTTRNLHLSLNLASLNSGY